MQTFLCGAVAYDPKVVTIWEGFRAWFAGRGFDFDFVLYSNYEQQVRAHFAGAFHVAWNSPLAWIQARRLAEGRGLVCRTIAMRDTDRDLRSVIVVRADFPGKTLADLSGRRVGVGALDSPQATLIPRWWIAENGAPDADVLRFDRLLGKHGDHIGGERDAARALARGEVEAACMIDGNFGLFQREGTLGPGVRVLGETPLYDHCNMTVVGKAHPETNRFVELLLSMQWSDPEVRPLLEMEGLRRWLPGRTSGYDALEAAVDRYGAIDAFLREMA